jgi:lipid-binding SYLF domain-containing protein
MQCPKLVVSIAVGWCSLLLSAACAAQNKAAIDDGVQKTQQQFIELDPRHADLENRAAGVLIFPQITKGGMALAAEYGAGVLQVRGATVGYYSLAAASVGLTAGMATRSEIILFMTQEALDKFLKSRGWSIGAQTGIAMISKGAAGDLDSYTLKKPILGFVFGEKGLMADLSLEGSKIKRIER